MNNFLNETKNKFTLDTTLILILALHAVISIFAITMASPMLDPTLSNIVSKQIMWFGIGATFVYLLVKLGTDRLFTMIDILYWLLILALAGLVVFRVIYMATGRKFGFAAPINGSFAWYQIPSIGSFQPAEFMKIVLVIKAALIVDKHNLEKTEFSFRSDLSLAFKLLKILIIPLGLMILQPDTGIPIIIIASIAILFFVSGVKKEWFFVIFGGAMIIFFGFIWLYYNNKSLLATLTGGGYRLNRFVGWLDYTSDTQHDGFQLFRSMLSIGTSGWFGHRPLPSYVIYLPEAQTDFIFAIIAKSAGLVGAAFTVCVVFALDIKLIATTLRSDHSKERYTMIGIVGMLIFQQFQNIGMVMGLLPITGVTLPFISYGGSSIISYLIPIAIALNMHSENVRMNTNRIT